jgi:hypothetical protein
MVAERPRTSCGERLRESSFRCASGPRSRSSVTTQRLSGEEGHGPRPAQDFRSWLWHSLRTARRRGAAGGEATSDRLSGIQHRGHRPGTYSSPFARRCGSSGGSTVKTSSSKHDSPTAKSTALPTLVDQLLQLKVDILVWLVRNDAQRASLRRRRYRSSCLASADAVGEGFVASLARPGRNITGMTLLAGPEIAIKQLELLCGRSSAPNRDARRCS